MKFRPPDIWKLTPNVIVYKLKEPYIEEAVNKLYVAFLPDGDIGDFDKYGDRGSVFDIEQERFHLCHYRLKPDEIPELLKKRLKEISKEELVF